MHVPVITVSETGLLTNIHEGIPGSMNLDKIHLVKGNYEYYHYLCDGFDDRGWGCGYRTLQTICSWMKLNIKNCPEVPTISKIQETLVEIEDKPESFLGSKEWIGTTEVFLVIDKIYKIPCRTIHVRSGSNLASVVDALVTHFDNNGSPVMMGGNIDCGSKGIVGIDVSGTQPRLLIVDPHYVGKEQSKEFFQKKGWVKWQPLEEFLSSSFYNLCLPQVTLDVRVDNESHS